MAILVIWRSDEDGRLMSAVPGSMLPWFTVNENYFIIGVLVAFLILEPIMLIVYIKGEDPGLLVKESTFKIYPIIFQKENLGIFVKILHIDNFLNM